MDTFWVLSIFCGFGLLAHPRRVRNPLAVPHRGLQIFPRTRLKLANQIMIGLRAGVLKAPLRVLFCGNDFPSGFEFTKRLLAGEAPSIQLFQCGRHDLHAALADAHVAIPFMACC